jgi:hypothetical protein
MYLARDESGDEGTDGGFHKSLRDQWGGKRAQGHNTGKNMIQIT